MPNAARMHSLIDGILELAVNEAGTVTVEARPVRLRPLIGDVLTALGARATFGGEAGVGSTPGLGSTFIIELPVRGMSLAGCGMNEGQMVY